MPSDAPSGFLGTLKAKTRTFAVVLAHGLKGSRFALGPTPGYFKSRMLVALGSLALQ